jgi:uncharacterized iron-regulated membrane protein
MNMVKLVKLHMWIGVSAGLLLLMMAVTGLVLDHRLELRKMGGGLVYKLETKTKDQMYIDPVTGAVLKDGQGGVNIVSVAKMLHTGEGLLNSPWL